jgi:PPM family protein phosphatase
MKVRPGVEVAALTDIGCQRENNEDGYAYWEPEGDDLFARLGRLAVIADGMGGCEGGQHASRIAVDTVCKAYAGSTSDSPQQRLLGAFGEANALIQQKAREDPALHGMGTTLTACALVATELSFAHVGDSRLFLVRAGQVRQLTHDHSLVARLIESGTIRPEEADTHPQRHVLTAAVGVTEDLQPDHPLQPVQLESGDILVICTDGLWGQVSGPEMVHILESAGVQDGAKALVDLAKKRGGPDNITLQVLRLE